MVNVIWICFTNKTDIVLCCIFCGTNFKSLLIFLKKWILLFSIDALNWSKVTVKTFTMLQKILIENKFCSFELSIHQRILTKCFHVISSKAAKLFSTTKIIGTVSWAWFLKDHVCNTEDWSNDADNSALNHSNKLHFKIYSIRNKLHQIFSQ